MKHHYLTLRIALISLSLLLLSGIVVAQTSADPFSGSIVPLPNNVQVCQSTTVRVTVGNAVGASRTIEPGTVEWQINFPYDILILGTPTLPAPFFEFSRTCDPVTNEYRIVVRNNATIPFPTAANNFAGSQYFLDFPVVARLPNTSRNMTVTNFLIPPGGVIQGNLNSGNDNASSPIFFSPTACTQYRTKAAGNWDNINIWEVLTCQTRNETTCAITPGGWVDATQLPPSGAASVLIRHDVVLNIDFTVANCPLTLDNETGTTSKLTINPQITLDFGGGTDGNAYFNSRPVVVKSTADGTGAIGRMFSNSQTNGDNNVTVERYLPEGPQRRWNLLTFGVRGDATIRDAWAGGGRNRVSNSQNANAGFPLGNSGPKPNNTPFPTPGDYVPGDGTIITGHRQADAVAANTAGYDWWPELIIPAGEKWYTAPGQFIVVNTTQTTPSSIRPYRPGATPGFTNPVRAAQRGTEWISNNDINNGFGSNGLINMKLSDAYDQHQAFMLFTRGDRQVLENWFGATTLRPTGQLMKQSVSIPINVKGPTDLDEPFTVIGNPFPAPIDFKSIIGLVRENRNVIESYFHFWNSNLSGPGTVPNGHGYWETVYEISPGSFNRTVQLTPPFPPAPGVENISVINSSQGIMVKGKGQVGGQLTITEEMKAPINNVVIRPFEQSLSGGEMPGILYTNLNFRKTSTGELGFVDAINIVLNDKFKEDLSDGIDIPKINSHATSVGVSIRRGDELLVVEAHPNPTTEAVFPLYTPDLTERAYSFTFFGSNLDAPGREAFLRDKFLNRLTPISTTDATEYQFDGTPDKKSLNSDRFEIVLKSDNVLPVHFTRIHADEINKDIRVNWGIQSEDNMDRYEVEHSINGRDFGKAFNVAAKNESPAAYEWLHVQPGIGDHFYRIRAFSKDGRNLTTQVVKVTIGGEKEGGFKVFPTVVTRAMDINVQLLSLEKGRYTLQVLDMSGKVITSEVVQHNGGSAAMLLKLPSSLSAGQYQIRLFNEQVNFVEAIFRNK